MVDSDSTHFPHTACFFIHSHPIPYLFYTFHQFDITALFIASRIMAFQPADTDDWLSQLKEPKCGCHKYIEKEIDAKCARLEPWKPGNEPGTDATFDGRHLTLLSISKWKISGPPIDCADVKKHLTFTHSNSAKGRNVTQDRSSLRVLLLIVTPGPTLRMATDLLDRDRKVPTCFPT